MISADKLNAVKTIIVHDNCADGLASAILLKDAFFGRDIPIRFMQYGTDDHKNLVAEPGMLFADFSPPEARAKEFVDAGALVLDHHKTAKAVVEAFGENGRFGDEATDPGICGAMLAYQHVWLPLREQLAIQAAFAKKFATLAGVRDTWQRTSEHWREACLQYHILMFVPRDRWLAKTLTEIASTWESQFAWIGELIQEKQDRTVQKVSDKAYRFTTDKGTRVVVFEGVKVTSDTAEFLHDAVDLVVGFNYEVENGTPKVILSTRSHTTFDCAKMCKAHGGGGHTKAAGFNVQMVDTQELGVLARSRDPYILVEELVKRWEAKGA